VPEPFGAFAAALVRAQSDIGEAVILKRAQMAPRSMPAQPKHDGGAKTLHFGPFECHGGMIEYCHATTMRDG
jgi:hypothetical protein